MHDKSLLAKNNQTSLARPLPLGLYVHTPWCIQKCPYCDFNSHTSPDVLPAERYVKALLDDLEWQQSSVSKRVVDTLFIGGGTPSLFAPELVSSLLNGIKSRINVAEGAEITMEANPGALECGDLSAYREAGVNRLSLGVQSFNSQKLKVLGRIHGPEEAQSAAIRAQQAGFKELNLDLMFGLPGQSVAEAISDIQVAIAQKPTHISYYQLTLEPNTRFYSQPPVMPNEAEMEQIQAGGLELLDQSGYQRYEVSAFSRPGHQCRHNLNYWEFGDYLGLGAGAHGKVSRPEMGEVVRHWNVRNPEEYMAKVGDKRHRSGSRHLLKSDLVLEFMMNALRLSEGFEGGLFTSRTGIPNETIRPLLGSLQERGLLESDLGRVQPTELGMRFLDDLVLSFEGL